MPPVSPPPSASRSTGGIETPSSAPSPSRQPTEPFTQITHTNTMSNSTTPAPASALLSKFGEFTIPAGCRRIFITAELEPSNSDPRIQPTGFPDIGPVLYPDPNPDVEKNNGLICLIDGEAKVGQLLEEV